MGGGKSKYQKPNSSIEVLQLKDEKRAKKILNEQKRVAKLAKNNKKNHKKKNKKSKKQKITKEALQSSNELSSIVAAANLNVIFKDYEKSVNNELKKQISEKYSKFVLNQIVFSFQFFANYEQETAIAFEKIITQENEKNRTLDKHSIIFSNALDDAVAQRIQYQEKHGSNKYEQFPLQMQTMYVIFENVEISKPNDANYDSISPTCKVDIDSNTVGTSKKYKGYLRLRLRQSITKNNNNKNIINNNNNKISTRMSTTSCCSDSSIESSIYIQPRTELKLTPEYEALDLNLYRDSNSSGIDMSIGCESDYAYITSLNTNQPLNDLIKSNSKIMKNDNINSRALPDTCITIVKYVIENDDDDDEYNENVVHAIDHDNDNDNDDDFSDTDINDTIELKYLNSKQFLSYFANLLKDNLANELNLNESEFDGATWKGASINTKSYEIIPAIQVSCWPDCAMEWKYRNRKIRINPNNGKQYQWPTQTMIQDIQLFGCHVIPLGHAPKTHKNPYRELEWKIVFPKAERYLESHLTSTQVKIFMICKVLIKTFLEPQQKKDIFMFTMDHLRMHLFWQCEEDYGAFPEEFLGEVLLRFLRSFLECTRIKILKDYFVSERNLFESIPESTLNRIHTTISQIIQNPVIHIITAYRNLEQIEQFFPKLNYNKIYNIITVDNPLKIMDNNKLVKNSRAIDKMNQFDKDEQFKKQIKFDIPNSANSEWMNDDNDNDNIGLIEYSQKLERGSVRRKSKRIKKRQKQLSIKRKLTGKIEKKMSIDSIDLQFYCAKNLDEIERTTKKEEREAFDNIRRTQTVELFIKHFIAMAKSFCHTKSISYSKMYLNQASQLCSLLRTFDYVDLANKFLANIAQIREHIEILRTNVYDFRPALPKRISLEPVKSFNLNNKVIKSPTLQRKKHQQITITAQINNEENKLKTVHFKEQSFFEPITFQSTDNDIHEPVTILRMNSRENQKSPTRPLSGGILKQTSIELPKITPRISEEFDEIDETGKDFSEIFQLRKKAIHRLLKNRLISVEPPCVTLENGTADSTDL